MAQSGQCTEDKEPDFTFDLDLWLSSMSALGENEAKVAHLISKARNFEPEACDDVP